VGDSVWLAGDQLHVANDQPNAPKIYLGQSPEGQEWFAQTMDAVPDGADFRPIRGLAMEGPLPAEQISMLAQARSMLHWHERHGFCANCGGPTVMMDAGYRRHCAACSADHFPRTDPVVIMAVRHQGQHLLGRQASWPENMYSTLAGFMEPGETIEQAARREVFEEAGITVGPIRYVTCQPWPYPSNLMIGLIGEALTTDIVVDTKELEIARWFSAEEATMMLDRTHPGGLWATNTMAIAYHILRAAISDT
jgi:NAD+ diphosphatase